MPVYTEAYYVDYASVSETLFCWANEIIILARTVYNVHSTTFGNLLNDKNGFSAHGGEAQIIIAS